MIRRLSVAWVFASLFTLVTAATFASEPVHTGHVRVKHLPGGAAHYLITHSGQGRGYVDSVVEAPGQLPQRMFRRGFDDTKQAEAFARQLGKQEGYQEADSDLGVLDRSASDRTVTEVPGQVLWTVTNDWSWDWEKKYAEWIDKAVTVHFMEENKIATDCADVAYTLRWVFARMNGLPAANHIGGSTLFTQDSMKTEWAALPTDPDWSRDQRFRAALTYLLDLVYTHTLIGDSYPVAITPESLLPGTHHLFLSGDSGHTMILHHVNLADDATVPLLVMYSTVPQDIRELAENGYWEGQQPQEGQGGFLRLRWPVRQAGGQSGQSEWTLAAPESQPYFLREEFQPGFLGDRTSFAEAVLIKLNPKLDYRSRLKEGIQYLKDRIQARLTVVSQGYTACQSQDCSPGTPGYENWSTPSRDSAILMLIGQLQQMVRDMGAELPDLAGMWGQAFKDDVLELDGRSYTLGTLVAVWRWGVFSSDPRNPVAARWGLAPETFGKVIGNRYEGWLQARAARIAESGAQCADPGACEPGGGDWNRWNTFDLDVSLRSSPFLSEYCTADASLCDPATAVFKQRRIDAGGLSLTVGEWLELSPWMISDPRVSVDRRWGSQRAAFRFHVFAGTPRSEVSDAGRGLDEYGNLMNWLDGTQLVTAAADTYTYNEFNFRNELLVSVRRPINPQPVTVRFFQPDRGWFFERNYAAGDGLARVGDGIFRTIGVSTGRVGLLDFNRSPVFEAALPAPILGPFQLFPSWIAAGTAPGSFELVEYRDGTVMTSDLTLPGPDYKLSFLTQEFPAHYIGVSTSGDGTQWSYCAIDKKTHRVFNILGPNVYPVAVPGGLIDGRWLLVTVVSTEHPGRQELQLLELDGDLNVLSRRTIGGMYTGYSLVGQGFYVSMMEPEAPFAPGLMIYRDGSWTHLALRPDEQAITANLGPFVLLQLSGQGQRLRNVETGQTLIETTKDRIVLVGLEDHGTALKHVALFSNGNLNWGGIYDVADLRNPLVTGITVPWSGLGGAFQLTRNRGLLMPFSQDGRSLWFEPVNR